jgi:hypothetical protein
MGLLALCGFLLLAYIARYPDPVGGHVLQFLANVGLVNREPSYIAELKPASLLSINDSNAILWLHWCASALTLVACSLALVSEWRREASAYSAAAFILPTAGLWLISPLAGLGSQFIGGVVLAVIRRRNAIET